MNAKDHYDKHLGNFYSWMYGDFKEKQLEQEKFFQHHNILPFLSKLAFDLGAGHGLQTVSLAKLGFTVKAIDFNSQLLKELKHNVSGMDVEIIEEDLSVFLKRQKSRGDVIVCMGDTISHLEQHADVNLLLEMCADRLVEGGKIILSFRDLTNELIEEHRFIPVKSDGNRISSCFLEYFPHHVMVYDILYEKNGDAWSQKVSAYPKLRLNENIITDLLNRNGFKIIHSEIINRMIYLIGERQIL